MIDGIPEVRDFIASGLVRAEADGQGRTVYRTTPEVHRQINAALAERGRAARDRRAGAEVTAILCGGEPSEHDRQIIRDFADALAIDDEGERRAAVLAIQDKDYRAEAAMEMTDG